MRYRCCKRIFITGILLLSLVACSRPELAQTQNKEQSLNQDTEAMDEEEVEDKNLMGDEEPENAEDAVEESSFDLDLTTMSSTMVYSEVYNIMVSPKDYIGKTIKMKGTCSIYPGENGHDDYYACVIMDATACCAQGIEFVLKDGQEYPKEGDPVEVSGVFDTYDEDGTMYCHLTDATRYE